MVYWKQNYEQITANEITFNLLFCESVYLRIFRVFLVFLLLKSSISGFTRNLNPFEV